MKKYINIGLICWVVLLNTPFNSTAQCAMCRATVENGKTNQTNETKAKGLNAGILYLMIVPYLLFVVIGYNWYRNSKKEYDSKNKVSSILKRKVSQM